MTQPLRDVARNAVRGEVLEHAWTLFAGQGFGATTVEQVAEAAGMSRRTFFRYFSGKDELISARMLDVGERVAGALAARPPDEPAWPALRAAFDAIVAPQEAHPEPSRTLYRLLREEPDVRGTLEARYHQWVETLAPLVVDRLPAGSHRDLRAIAVTSSALACLHEAQAAWGASPESRLTRLLDAAMSAVSPLTQVPSTRTSE